jgi:chromosomal replication initiation ATPase DnaA
MQQSNLGHAASLLVMERVATPIRAVDSMSIHPLSYYSFTLFRQDSGGYFRVQSQEEEREQQKANSPSFPVASLKSSASFFVGREQELARLHELFARAQRGERQTLFVFGEPGIGKTALVDCFLDQVRTNGSVRIGRGQCIEHYGPGEAYLPILEALGQLCHELGGEQVMAVLRRHAPSWMAL